MKTSRQQILEVIQQQRAATIPQLSETLHSTQANVRHHLNILMQQGLVQVAGRQPSMGRGRPAQIFSPPPESRGGNLPMLTGLLLGGLDESHAPRLGEQMAQAMLPTAAPSEGGKSGAAPSLPSAQRFLAAVDALNRHAYEAHWEARLTAPQLIIDHCPYWQVIGEHPWLCQVDLHLLEALLGAPAQHTARLVADGKHGQRCIFQVSKP